MLNKTDQEFSFTITNLSNEGSIGFGIRSNRKLVNRGNFLTPGRSVTVNADRTNEDRAMILGGMTKAVKDQSGALNVQPVSVQETENKKQEDSLHFDLVVIPMKNSAVVEHYKQGTVWKVVPGFVVPVQPVPSSRVTTSSSSTSNSTMTNFMGGRVSLSAIPSTRDYTRGGDISASSTPQTIDSFYSGVSALSASSRATQMTSPRSATLIPSLDGSAAAAVSSSNSARSVEQGAPQTLAIPPPTSPAIARTRTHARPRLGDNDGRPKKRRYSYRQACCHVSTNPMRETSTRFMQSRPSLDLESSSGQSPKSQKQQTQQHQSMPMQSSGSRGRSSQTPGQPSLPQRQQFHQQRQQGHDKRNPSVEPTPGLVESASPPPKLDVGTTQAGELRHGRKIATNATKVKRRLAKEYRSPPTKLCLSLWEDMDFLPLPDIKEELRKQTEDLIKNEGKRLLESLNAVYSSEKCVVDLESEADTVICTCGHRCIHHSNITPELLKCPLCRSPITAFVKATSMMETHGK